MYLKNTFKPGQFVTLVPVGLHLTLQYGEKGILEKVYTGFENSRVDVTDSLFQTLFKTKTVPTSVPIKGGTVWVYGVLTGQVQFNSDGYCNDVASSQIFNDFQVYPNKFKFLAGNVRSTAANFAEVSTIRRWLKMALFDLLPGFLCPALTDKTSILNAAKFQIKNSRSNIVLPMISAYMLFNGSDVQYVDTKIRQFCVSDVSVYTDEYGRVLSDISSDTSKFTMTVPYSTLTHYSIRPKVFVVLDAQDTVIYSFASSGNLKHYDNVFRCSWCGKISNVPPYGDETVCSDVHCPSRCYKDLEHFCMVLSLPCLSFEKYQSLSKDREYFWVPDIFTLPEYKSIQLKIDLSTLLDALVPVLSVPDRTCITAFANNCTNSTQTCQYYINNPDKICVDFDLNINKMHKFIMWIQDNTNAKMVETLMFSNNFDITDTNKKFDGAPIFRNNTIMITGDFIHGSSEDIKSILQSYAATVKFDLDDDVQCVVTGATKCGINGAAVRKARYNHIPVIDELDFFANYDIDSDIKQNLK